jgi:hypothetical protein
MRAPVGRAIEMAGHAFALTPALSRKREREFQKWRDEQKRDSPDVT